MGHLLVYLNATTDPETFNHFELGTASQPLLRLWPLDNSVIMWPPKFFVTDPYIDDLSTAFERFLNSDGVSKIP
jgi:hypothetical protein